MTPDQPPVPVWLTAAWDQHLAKTGEHWCSTCSAFLVPYEGAVCPCCDPAAQREATA